MLISEGSLADVNKKLPSGVSKVTMDQFRPNFVASGCDAFDEDSWKDVYIGGVKYTNIKKCDRCILTTVNPKTGTKHPDMEPLKTLRSYRLIVPEFDQAPCFGVNFVADWTGNIHVGDEILATK
ncbi:hypothetical protein NP493_82g04008 [Ridgeia piscesae]|uniref:MOSC domain-containing protein n=1 Tax=Ridgeia piscesae TaxID=27915 RepID=A0AAD9P919_RIDPI|nr:hypothetical protein NP493_82g04008 [Ridgeia piscesae]